MKVKEINSNKIKEYKKYIQFNENLISLYDKINNTTLNYILIIMKK